MPGPRLSKTRRRRKSNTRANSRRVGNSWCMPSRRERKRPKRKRKEAEKEREKRINKRPQILVAYCRVSIFVAIHSLPLYHTSPVKLLVLLLERLHPLLVTPEIHLPWPSPPSRLQIQQIPNNFTSKVPISRLDTLAWQIVQHTLGIRHLPSRLRRAPRPYLCQSLQ